MDEQSRESRRKRISVVTWGCCLVLVFSAYVLSIGPVAWMEQKGMLPEGGPAYDALVLLYAPLEIFGEWKIEPFFSALDTYINWWTS